MSLRSTGLTGAAAIAIALAVTHPGVAAAPSPSPCATAQPGNLASAFLAIITSAPHPASSPIGYEADIARFKANLECAHAGDLDYQAAELGTLALIESRVGRYTDALDDGEQTLAIDERLKNRDAQGRDNLVIGDTESAIGLFQDAMAHYRTAIELFHDVPDVGLEALAYRAMAVATERETEEGVKGASYAVALALVDRADELLGHTSVQTLIARALIESKAGNYRQGAALFKQLLKVVDDPLYASGVNSSSRAAELTEFAAIEVQQKNYADAATYAHAGATIDKTLGLPQWPALATAAGAEGKLPDSEQNERQALSDFDGAINDIERLRAGISESEAADARSSFFQTALYVYDSYIEYLLDLDRLHPNHGYADKALEVFERREGRAFLEQVGRSSAASFADAPRELVDQEAALKENVIVLSDKFRNAAPGPAADAYRSNRDDAEAKLNAFEASLRESAPAYYRLLHPRTLRLPDYQRVLHANEAVLVYDVLQDRTALWVITPRAVRLFVLPASGSAALAARLAAASAGKCRGQGYPGVADAIDRAMSAYAVGVVANADLEPCASGSAALYSYLVPSTAAAMIEPSSMLYIVPTGPIYGLPFEALVTARGSPPRYLIEDKAIAYLSSASLLEVLRSGVEQRRTVASNPLVAFADPDYSETGKPAAAAEQLQNRILLRSASVDGAGFPALPGSKIEADASFEALGVSPSNTSFYRGDRATLQNIEALNANHEGLRAYRYVLFGTHAVLPYQYANFSEPAIVLAHPQTDDDYLKMGQVFGLSLDADAVVLSACESGSIQSAGDSVEGLTQAFMYAGTPIVAVTDWAVVDSIQEQLTPKFFAAMAQGKTAAQALREAKLALIHSGNPLESHPYFWAPMVIFGDGDAR